MDYKEQVRLQFFTELTQYVDNNDSCFKISLETNTIFNYYFVTQTKLIRHVKNADPVLSRIV